MKFKSFAVILALIFLFQSLDAQKSNIILRAGVNLANVSTKANGRFDEANTFTSFQVGILKDLHLASMFYLQPGVVFTGKGSKVVNGDESSSTFYKATSNPFYIEIPLTFLLKSPGKTKLLFGAGPYLAFGVSGKNKVEGKILSSTFKHEEKIQFSDDDPTTLDYEEGAGLGIMKRVDYGLNGIVGVECKRVIFAGHFGYGLAKLQSGSGSGDDDYNKHRVISFTIGLKF